MKLRLAALTTALLATLVAPAAGQTPVPGTTATPAAPASPAGPGWYLAQVDQGREGPYGIEARRTRLVLVAPDGSRTRVLERHAGWRLVDWSPDGATALLVAQDEEHPQVLRVDVATGETRRFDLPSNVAAVVLAPDGSGLLALGYEKRDAAPVSVIDWDGHRTGLVPDVSGPVLPSRDGTLLVSAGSGWRQQVIRVLDASDGSVVRRIETDGHCEPVRWWDDDQVLARCSHGYRPGFLALASTSTGTFTPLTDRSDRQRQDLGDLDARRTGSGLYLEIGGPCGYVYLARQHRDGSVTQVDVPHAVGNVLLLDSVGRRLVIQHAISCDGARPRSVIARFDPVTGRERVLAELARGQAFTTILRYGDRQPTGT